MNRPRSQNGRLVLFAASVLAAVLGSVHAFSVFMAPLETQFGASRAMVSLIYSLALVALTLAVVFGHRLFSCWRPGGFVLGIGLMAASGALIAATAPSLAIVWLGYGAMFGVANGLGYGFGLQIAAQANQGREGLAMGIVTAAYAFGAAVSPPLFTQALTMGGFRLAMLGLGAALIAAAALSAALLQMSHADFRAPPAAVFRPKIRRLDFSLLWVGYGAAVAGGLMVIGHAAGIARASSSGGASWAAPALLAICNLGGSLITGRLVDRPSGPRLLAALPLLSAAALGILALSGKGGLVMPCLAAAGIAYGGIIAAYPAVITKTYGVLNSPQIYGQVFTAWGCAGLFGPWFAGRLFDWSGSYQLALLTAAALSVVSTAAIISFFSRQTPTPRPVAKPAP